MGQYSLFVDSFTIGHFKCINSKYIWVVKIRNTSKAKIHPIRHFKCINSKYIWVVKIRNTSKAKIHPMAIILTTTLRALVSMIA